jgi:hypothetical protein
MAAPARTDSMRTRLLALVRKAGVKESDAAELVETLTGVLHTKREYEAALGSDDGAEAFARRHHLPPDQERILMAMQVRVNGRRGARGAARGGGATPTRRGRAMRSARGARCNGHPCARRAAARHAAGARGRRGGPPPDTVPRGAAGGLPLRL